MKIQLDIYNLASASPYDAIPGNFTFYLAARTRGNVIQYKPIVLSHNIPSLNLVEIDSEKKNKIKEESTSKKVSKVVNY